jgi:hypothetical protein
MLARIGCLVVLVLAAVLGWVYRREVVEQYRRLRGLPPPAVVEWTAPAAGDLERARIALDRLARPGGPAYVDLTVAELAALVEAELAAAPRRVVDSLRVALGGDEVQVRALLDLSEVPPRLLGPLAGALDRREPVTVGGALTADTAAAHLDWTITSLKVRDFPFPRGTIPAILRALRVPGLEGAAVPIPTPASVGDVRVSPSRVRLYRRSPR